MDYLDYGSGAEDDDCYVDDVEYDQDKEDYQNPELLTAVNDLEFIASHAADYNFDFNAENNTVMEISLPASAMEEDDSSSDEESDSEAEVDEAVGQVEDKAVESSSSSDSSDSEDEVITKKQYNKQSKQIHWLTEEEGEDMATGPLKTKNEIDEVVEPLDHSHIEIRDTADLTTIGEVMYRIDHECVVVIQSDYTTSPLNEGSIICNIDGKVLGKVQEIFGPITTPFYTVRWKNVTTAPANNNKGKGGGQNKKQNNKQKGKKGTADCDAAVAVAADAAVQLVALSDAPVVAEVTAMDTEIELDATLPADVTAPATDTAVDNVSGDNATVTASEAGIPETSVIEPKVAPEQAAPKSALGLEISDVRALFPVGARLFTVNSYASFVLPSQLQKAHVKGSDASNAYDEEPPEEELEYSDDEQEMLAKQARKASKKGTSSAPVSAANEANFGDAIPTGYEKAGFGRGRGNKKVPNFGAAGARSAGVPAPMVPQQPVYGQYANAVPMQTPYPGQQQHMQMPMQGYPPMQQSYAVPMHHQPPMQQQPMHGNMYGQQFQPQQQYPAYASTMQQPQPPPPAAPVPYMSAYHSGGMQYGMPQMQAPNVPAGYAPSQYAQAPPMPGYATAPAHSAQGPPVPQYQYMPIQYGAGAPGAPPAGPPNMGQRK